MLDKQVLQIFKVASKDSSRPVLTGIKFSKVKHNGGWAIKLAATDGYRLTEKLVEVDFEPNFPDMIIPASTVEAVSKLLDKNRKAMLSETQFKIMRTKAIPEGILERTITIGETIKGNFPEYEQLLPEGEPESTVTISSRYLIEALKQSNGETVTLSLHGKQSPVVVKDGDETTVTSVVMPLRS